MILELVLHPQKNRQSISLNFLKENKKNILMKGSEDMRFESKNASFNIIEKRSKKTKGQHAVDNITTIYVYGEVLDKDNLSAKNVTFSYNNSQLQISDGNASTTLYVKYGISYISAKQAQQNFNKEVGKKTFDEISKAGKKEWGKVSNQIQVEGGTTAQKKNILYRIVQNL